MLRRVVVLLLVLDIASATCRQHRPVPSECEQSFGNGWNGTLRADGTVMCIKVFYKEFKTYSEVIDFCNKQGGFVAPISSKAEQETLEDMLLRTDKTRIQENKKGGGGAVYIGAVKIGNMSARGKHAVFQWEFDKRNVSYANWFKNEPNDRWHADAVEGHEKCIAVFVDKENKKYRHWMDQNCAPADQELMYRIVGGVCGKELI